MKRKGFNGKMLTALLFSALTGFIASLAVAAVGSYLVASEKVGESAVTIIVVIALLLGSLVSAFMAMKRGQGSRLVMSLAGAGGYLLVLLCCGALVFDGIRGGVGMTALMALCGAFAVWIMGLKGSKKSKYRLPKL